ncbi:MAG: hypothetical protein HYX33_04100 [Actinobacteria bacterium]|nr:hypothetical protein [Actinomycetota bacterium]
MTTTQRDDFERPREPPTRRTLRGDLERARHSIARLPRSPRVILAVASLVGGLGVGFLARTLGPQLKMTGPAAGAFVGPVTLSKLQIRVTSSNPSTLASATLSLNGGDITDASRTDDGFRFRPETDLPDGRYTVELRTPQPILPWPSRQRWTFTVDRAPPVPSILSGREGNARGRPVRIVGGVNEPARVLVNGRPVLVADNRFQIALPAPPDRPLTVRAIDRAGNSSTITVPVAVTPRTPQKPVRGVHVSAIAWRNRTVREEIFAQIAAGALTTVELDLKDERGEIGYTSSVPLARRMDASRGYYDLRQAVADIHARGGYVVGRQVVFRDPLLASYALRNGNRAAVVQRPDGTPYSANQGFTNLANRGVRDYNVALAVEAARAGVDEVLFDYVRRPDGPVSQMRFPGLRDSPVDEIVRFLATTQTALQPYPKTLLGASIFGIAAGRRGPSEIAQDVPRMAQHLDVVAPMVYPAVWGPGEYQVADPERDPGTIVRRSLRVFATETAGTGARLVPWLQNYTKSVPYGAAEVRAQIDAAKSLGIDEFLMWNPEVEYSFAGLPIAPLAATTATTAAPVTAP